jgi:hypothetical protein
MPSIKASAKPSLKGWEPAQNASAEGGKKATPPPEPDPTARSPFMRASMPLMASTGDAFARQFYAQNGLPSYRILPAKRGGGA